MPGLVCFFEAMLTCFLPCMAFLVKWRMCCLSLVDRGGTGRAGAQGGGR